MIHLDRKLKEIFLELSSGMIEDRIPGEKLKEVMNTFQLFPHYVTKRNYHGEVTYKETFISSANHYFLQKAMKYETKIAWT
jgi:hypothetical protein